jgi:hypothetical protein
LFSNYFPFKDCSESSSTSEQIQHQEHVSDERYACIYRNLAKFDKQKQLSTYEYPTPVIRAALCRAQFKKNKNLRKNSNKLLCLTANLVSNLSFSSFPIFFNGLKQAGKYRENLLHGLWNYQLFDLQSEQRFNQWLSHQSSSSCSVCYFFQANQIQSSLSIRSFLISEVSYPTIEHSNELLQCSLCHISVHRQCYESICLAMNAEICEEDEPWLCQRCAVKNQVNIFITGKYTSSIF